MQQLTQKVVCSSSTPHPAEIDFALLISRYRKVRKVTFVLAFICWGLVGLFSFVIVAFIFVLVGLFFGCLGFF